MDGNRIQSVEDLQALTDEERTERRRALRALSLARAEGWPIQWAANELGLDIDAVDYWVGDALEPTRGGLSHPKRSDEIIRFRPLYVDGRLDLVAAHGSEQSDLFADIFDAQYRFIQGRAPASELRRYAGLATSDGGSIDTDPEVLKRAAIEEPEVELYRDLY